MNNSAKICPSCKTPFIRNHTPESYQDENCFDCSFWLKKITMPKEDQKRRVIIAGQHYMMGANTSGPKGFGGIRFAIHFNDGRTIETCNLLCFSNMHQRMDRVFLKNKPLFKGLNIKIKKAKIGRD